jgi:membrane protein implicated in regulation of membrane protease activity
MYIIAIAWIYVTLLMAVTEANVTAGILTFSLYGLLPLSLLLWLFGTPMRRRRLRSDAEKLDQGVGKSDGPDPGADQ